jgi:hypothetical protein
VHSANGLAAGALAVSVVAAGYYRSQALSVKRAAKAAEDSVGLAKQSAGTAERAASASEHSAIASAHAAGEARRMRQDALGPSVVIDKVTRGERWMSGWNGPADSPPGIASPGTELTTSAQDHVPLLIGAHIAVRNEGTRTARVQFEGHRVDRAGLTDDSPETVEALEPPSTKPSPRVGGGTITLQPGEASGVIMRVGVTLTTCTIITVAPNHLAAEVHDRMPLIPDQPAC